MKGHKYAKHATYTCCSKAAWKIYYTNSKIVLRTTLEATHADVENVRLFISTRNYDLWHFMQQIENRDIWWTSFQIVLHTQPSLASRVSCEMACIFFYSSLRIYYLVDVRRPTQPNVRMGASPPNPDDATSWPHRLFLPLCGDKHRHRHTRSHLGIL